MIENIENINIKDLSYKDLDILAKETREYMVDEICKVGGHLASSLGVVDLTLALLKTFDFPDDKIIWDVGHQSYAYKILTDRKDKFKTIRRYDGISGFPKRKESKYDSFNTGHASNSISAGLGMVVARDLDNKSEHIISVIGDGALTGGEAFEALHNVSKIRSNYIIILNDNEMSISKSSGGMTHALSGVRTSRRYNYIKNVSKELLDKIPGGHNVRKGLSNILNAFKQVFVKDSGMLFENLDIVYLGPVDGHNIKSMVEILNNAKKLDRPVVIHVKTKKGKGYKPAEEDPVTYHGVAPFDKGSGLIIKNENGISYTKIFGDKICEVASKNKNVVCITAAMPDGTGLNRYQKEYKDRFYDVGICEEHAVTFAAGLAVSGKVPIVCIYSSFLQRAYDQIIEDVCMQDLHVIFMIDRAGIVGRDGETHHGAFDISYMNMIPRMTILAPKNGIELDMMIDFAINKCEGPVAIRYPRGEVATSYIDKNEEIVYGKSEILEKGENIAILAYGSMVDIAKEIKNRLKNIDPTIVNLRFAKPYDKNMIDDIVKDHKKIYVMEEGMKIGGIGDTISNYIYSKYNDVDVINIGIDDIYMPHGEVKEIRKYAKIDTDSIIERYFNE